MEYFPNKHIFLPTPNVGAEFLVDLDGSMFLRIPSVGAACGLYMILILGA
jgi:hypothetical protein